MKIKSKVRLDLFDKNVGLKRGKNRIIEAMWHVSKMIFFLSYFPWPQRLKRYVLLLFGAQIGRGVHFQPNVNIHFPWKLEIGNNSWIGQGSLLLNFEKLIIGSNVAIAHRVFISCGNHNYRQENYPYMNKPIIIKDGVVVATNVFIGPGVEIGTDAVITAGAVITKNVAPNTIWSGNPAQQTGIRWK